MIPYEQKIPKTYKDFSLNVVILMFAFNITQSLIFMISKAQTMMHVRGVDKYTFFLLSLQV